jgi:hypothetical protein
MFFESKGRLYEACNQLRKGFCSLLLTITQKEREGPMESLLQDRKLPRLLEKVDQDLAEEGRKGGCRHCGGKVHRADYERKPRGGPVGWDKRDSFCCAEDGCRRRLTPPSVRFLGRRVYVAVVVVLMAAMQHGLKAERVKKLHTALGIDVRTLQRWREWRLSTFVNSAFWKQAKACFIPPLEVRRMPLALMEAFGRPTRARFLELLKFLSPLTTATGKGVEAM